MKNNIKNRSEQYSGENQKLVDMSRRKKLTIEYDDFNISNNEETSLLLEEMQTQRLQVKNEYYSSNASIDRINQRNFWDILKAKYSRNKQRVK